MNTFVKGFNKFHHFVNYKDSNRPGKVETRSSRDTWRLALTTRIHFVALNCCLTLNSAFKLQAIKYLEAHLDKESCTVIFAALIIFQPFQNHARS